MDSNLLINLHGHDALDPAHKTKPFSISEVCPCFSQGSHDLKESHLVLSDRAMLGCTLVLGMYQTNQTWYELLAG